MSRDKVTKMQTQRVDTHVRATAYTLLTKLSKNRTIILDLKQWVTQKKIRNLEICFKRQTHLPNWYLRWWKYDHGANCNTPSIIENAGTAQNTRSRLEHMNHPDKTYYDNCIILIIMTVATWTKGPIGLTTILADLFSVRYPTIHFKSNIWINGQLSLELNTNKTAATTTTITTSTITTSSTSSKDKKTLKTASKLSKLYQSHLSYPSWLNNGRAYKSKVCPEEHCITRKEKHKYIIRAIYAVVILIIDIAE